VFHERDNMRAALAWAAEMGDQTLGLALVVALENYWATASPEEGLEWATALLAGADRTGAVDPGLVARALRVQGGMQNVLGQVDASDASWEQALAIVRRLGDDRAVAILLHRFSNTAMKRGDPRRVRELAEESLEGHRRAGHFPKGEAQAMTSLAWVAQQEGDFEGALELLHEARAKAAEAGFRWWEAGTLANIGAVSLQLGKLDDAGASMREALSISNGMRDRRGVVYELRLLMENAAAGGDARLAAILAGAIEAEEGRAPVGRWVHSWAREPVEVPLDDEALDEGRRLSLDDAVALALGAT
jgi:tetratricopeptide (TPR) repeat protein